MKKWRRRGGIGVGAAACPYVLTFTAVDGGGGDLQLEWSTVPPFSEDCLLNCEIQLAGGDWSSLEDSFTSASAVDTALRAVGTGIFDARARVECFGSPCGDWVTVSDVEVT